MYGTLADIAGAFGLAAGFAVFTNLSLQPEHSRRYLLGQFLMLFLPLVALMIWYAVPVSQALIVGATGGACAIFFLVGLAVVRQINRDIDAPKN